ncbi:hypothetical protein [Blastococcus deserti]|uniref:Uncharacterized protein n=1 Tax=Blastococcus deserti TaxID=2259033 RepID=A0ABW4XFG7_9ACTN
MSESAQYRSTTIEVRKKDDGSEELVVNGEPIDVTPDPSNPGMFTSRYTFLSAPALRELGELVVDAQLALTDPKLKSLKRRKKGS